MSSYELADVSLNLASGEPCERLGKFLLINLAVGIVVTIIIVLLAPTVFKQSVMVGFVFVLGVMLLSNAGMLGWYERWRGCYFKKD